MIMVDEEMLNRYHELNQQKKDIDNEMAELKKVFHQYFDTTIGQKENGETIVGDFMLQRQIRGSESLDEERTVHLLEELNLTDCIETVKRPDRQKIDAAVTLGLLSQTDIEDCIIKKVTQAIIVKKAGI
jgi:hypothetical protein